MLFWNGMLKCLKAKKDDMEDVVKEASLPQEFPKMQQPKEGSNLWENDSWCTSDCGQKKYSSLSRIDKEESCNNQVARAADPKEPTELF